MKSKLLELINWELRARFERLAKAALDAHAAATDPGSKAESKYDTRSLEESYLATGQARQVEELADTLQIFEKLKPIKFSKNDEIASGALVELKRGNEMLSFLLVPAAGGLEILHNKKEITLLSPESPLYRALIGKKAGDTIDAPAFQVHRVS
jgi:transcription elongation GreA/GreB family factor